MQVDALPADSVTSGYAAVSFGLVLTPATAASSQAPGYAGAGSPHAPAAHAEAHGIGFGSPQQQQFGSPTLAHLQQQQQQFGSPAQQHHQQQQHPPWIPPLPGRAGGGHLSPGPSTSGGHLQGAGNMQEVGQHMQHAAGQMHAPGTPATGSQKGRKVVLSLHDGLIYSHMAGYDDDYRVIMRGLPGRQWKGDFKSWSFLPSGHQQVCACMHQQDGCACLVYLKRIYACGAQSNGRALGG